MAIEEAVREGRLKAGVALPGSRALAEDLGVNRNTVIAALEMLVAEGWLEVEPNRGTFVSPTHPASGVDSSAAPVREGLGFELPSRMTPITENVSGVLNLSDGHADSRLAPTEAMAKAYQRALRRHGQDLLRHGEAQGNGLLRETLAKWASERHGVRVDVGQVLITSGIRASLQLICGALVKAGDSVVVENPGNPMAWEIFRRHGAKIVLVPVDGEGIVPEALAGALESNHTRLIYLTPRRQFPTTTSLSAERARQVLELAAAHRIAILEDDADAEIHFGEQPQLPLYARDTTGQVLFGGGFSRLLAPGLKVGYLVVPSVLVSPMARLRRDLELQGDPVLEWSVAELLRDGDVDRHLRRVRKVYASRRDVLADCLRSEFGDSLAFDLPDGGQALWLRPAGNTDVEGWIREAKGAGLVLHPPRRYHLGDPGSAFRMGFSHINEQEIEEAVRRLANARSRAVGG